MEQLGSHQTDFNDTWYLSFCRKSLEKIKISLKSDKNNGYFIWRRFDIFYDISLSSSQNGKYFRQIYRENQNIHFVFSNPFPKIAPFMRLCWKMWWRPRGHKWRHNMAHTRCVMDLQGYMNLYAGTLPRACVPTCTHAPACTHRPISNTRIAFPRKQWFRERACVTLYVHCLSCSC
jgi:hypothetical protein